MADHFKRALLLRGGILFQERITSVNTGGGGRAPRESSRVPETLGIPIHEPGKSEKRKEMGREREEERGGEGETSRPRGIRIRDPQREQRWFRNGRVNYIPRVGDGTKGCCDAICKQTFQLFNEESRGDRPIFIRFLKITPDYRPSNVSSRRIPGRF